MDTYGSLVPLLISKTFSGEFGCVELTDSITTKYLGYCNKRAGIIRESRSRYFIQHSSNYEPLKHEINCACQMSVNKMSFQEEISAFRNVANCKPANCPKYLIFQISSIQKENLYYVQLYIKLQSCICSRTRITVLLYVEA